VKDENGDLLVDFHNILNRWKNYFSRGFTKKKKKLWKVHNARDAGQIEIHMAEPLVPGPSRLEVEIAIAKLKKYKSPGSDQIPAELNSSRRRVVLSSVKLVSLIFYK
jgi:hypothetical protein